MRGTPSNHTQSGDHKLIDAACRYVMRKKYGILDFYVDPSLLEGDRIRIRRHNVSPNLPANFWPIFDPINDRGHLIELQIIDETLELPAGVSDCHARGRREALTHWAELWAAAENTENQTS